MSTKYPGGFITKNYVAPTPSSAKGVWTLDQQMQAQKTGTWPFGGPFNYIEDVFSTYLYTGNSSTQTINNGIDLAGNGGLTWIKRRTSEAHYLFDTNRGALAELNTDGTEESQVKANSLTSFNSDGFSLGSWGGTNYSVAPNNLYASWTFRKQPKFFDVVTYTGNGTAGRTVAHNLGAVPGMLVVKNITSGGTDWAVWHRSLPSQFGLLNLTNAFGTSNSGYLTSEVFGNDSVVVQPTETNFTVASSSISNASGQTYVAYLFAHDAGGFGATGTDNVVSCGSYTGTGVTGLAVTLGYEPQWVMMKQATSGGGGWGMVDVMRGMNGVNSRRLLANSSSDEGTTGLYNVGSLQPTATGFTVETNDSSSNGSGITYIYIAIRRGPMKVPTDGTSVFSPIAAVTGTQTTNFPIDMMMQFWRTSNDIYANTEVVDRLRGVSSNSTAQSNYLLTTSTGATDSLGSINASKAWSNTGFDVAPAYAGGSNVFECFRRAPSFFDEVCYTGTGSATTVTHNLGAVPELLIIKTRSNAVGWAVSVGAVGYTTGGRLELTDPFYSEPNRITGTPTTTTFPIGTDAYVNVSARTYVAYLFATCPGVSKVGSYTGTGGTQTIACGFAAGARFVLIKRTDSTGDWYVWDSARGMVSGTDPSLLLNSTAAEVNANSIYAITTGFQIVSTAAGINASGGSYIFLAIA